MSSLIAAGETFDGTWPYTAHYGEAAGFRQHYVDEGPQDPEHTLVLLHGEPTWGYLWRHLIGALSQRNRVIVPDHMGFGKSATPSDRTYLAGEHVDNLDTFPKRSKPGTRTTWTLPWPIFRTQQST